MKPLPKTWDAIFEKRLSVPVEYARALTWLESGQDPRQKTGSHWGLFQVGPENLADYNKASGTSWTMEDMLDPDRNAQVFAFESERIRAALVGAGLAENWQDRNWVRLFTAGWNSGYSNTAGVGKVLRWLKANGKELTHDNVFMFAKQAGGHWTLQSGNSKAAAKYKWQRDVAATYAAEAVPRDAWAQWETARVPLSDAAGTTAPVPAPERAQGNEPGGGGGGLLLIIIVLLLLAGRRR